MRLSRVLGAVLTVVALTSAGCTRAIDGTAVANGGPPPSAITADGYGIIIGYPDARVRIEVYTEPQCPACARLQSQYGDEMAKYIASGELAVTYRPMTFIDGQTGTDYSAHVSNALFLAAGDGTTGTSFQTFVEDVWGHQQPEGSAGPSDPDLTDMARESGIGESHVSKIASAESGVAVAEMDSYNSARLSETAGSGGTPTVYDLVAEQQVELVDNWLSELMHQLSG